MGDCVMRLFTNQQCQPKAAFDFWRLSLHIYSDTPNSMRDLLVFKNIAYLVSVGL